MSFAPTCWRLIIFVRQIIMLRKAEGSRLNLGESLATLNSALQFQGYVMEALPCVMSCSNLINLHERRGRRFERR